MDMDDMGHTGEERLLTEFANCPASSRMWAPGHRNRARVRSISDKESSRSTLVLVPRGLAPVTGLRSAGWERRSKDQPRAPGSHSRMCCECCRSVSCPGLIAAGFESNPARPDPANWHSNLEHR